MNSILPIVSTFLILTVIAVWGLASNKRGNGGFWVWERRKLLRSGSKGTAVVLKKIDLPETWSSGRYYRAVEAVVEVSVDGRPPYRTSITRDITRFSNEMNDGETLPACVDPENPKRVIVDVDEMKRAKDARTIAKSDAAEAEKRRLLGE